ncbi:protein cornichon homolog 4-like isoform 2-T3 [Salvelinus alpinus]
MEAAVFILSLVDCCALIFLAVYFVITLSDLECDYINARACCSKLNRVSTLVMVMTTWCGGVVMWVVPELVGQALATVLMLVSLHWFVFLLNLPVAAWNMYRVWKVPMGNMGVFDPTEIHNRGQLKSHMKESMIKLGFHLLCFFIYLYSMILALIND